MIVDLPALGKPTRPTSASSLSCSRRSFSSPGRPGCVRRGARLVEVAKRALPWPPRPPLAISELLILFGQVGDQRVDRRVLGAAARRPACRSAPASVMSAPVLPVRFEPSPLRAVARLEDLLEPEIEERIEVGVGDEVDVAAVAAVAAVRDRRAGRTSRGGSSARPLPPWPGRDVDVDFVDKHGDAASTGSGDSTAERSSAYYSSGQDRDDPAARAVVRELHGAVDLGEQRVVLAEPDVQARTEAASALAHQNRSAGHDVAVEALDAEALRVAVAPVAGAALSFFCEPWLDLRISFDAHARERAAMTLGAAHALPALLLEDADLRAARLAVDHAEDLDVGHERRRRRAPRRRPSRGTARGRC